MEIKDHNNLKRILIDKCFIDPGLPNYQYSPIVNSIQEKSTTKMEIIDKAEDIIDEYRHKANHIYQGKEILLVYPFKGRFIHICPGSGGMKCCHYFIINIGLNCLFDCHYCFLQTYLQNPLTTCFANWQDLKVELDRRLKNNNIHFRIGSGEYTDSMVLDSITGISNLLIKDFAKRKNCTLELKTKSANVDHILNIDHNGRTVMAWSLNPDSLIKEIEFYTPSLNERLKAAKKAQEAGYKLAFHFDPIVYYDNWQQEYKALIEKLLAIIEPDNIAWISLGTFRYSQGLKEIIQKRFPEDNLTRAEMVRCRDTKMRYVRKIRQDMYTKMKTWLEDNDSNIFTYICMDTKEVWQSVYGFDPGSRKKLDSLFEKRRKFMS
jgi:spore photoproduct lyase